MYKVQLLCIACLCLCFRPTTLLSFPLHAISYTQSWQTQAERRLTLKYSREEDETSYNHNARRKQASMIGRESLLTSPCMLRPSQEQKKMRDLKAKPL